MGSMRIGYERLPLLETLEDSVASHSIFRVFSHFFTMSGRDVLKAVVCMFVERAHDVRAECLSKKNFRSLRIFFRSTLAERRLRGAVHLASAPLARSRSWIVRRASRISVECSTMNDQLWHEEAVRIRAQPCSHIVASSSATLRRRTVVRPFFEQAARSTRTRLAFRGLRWVLSVSLAHPRSAVIMKILEAMRPSARRLFRSRLRAESRSRVRSSPGWPANAARRPFSPARTQVPDSSRARR